MLSNVDIRNIDPRAQFLDLDRADFQDSLYEFYKAAWRFIDPAPWKDSWAIDAIAEHLQAVVDGKIRRLIINCPPRIGKSSLTSVAFPAWTWTQPIDSHTSGPSVSFLFASYNDKLSLRDSVKCRRLIESPWYQARWGDRFQLTSDQNTKSRFTNDQRGERLITSVGAGVTGEGANVICIDDPQAANEVSSEAAIEEVLSWWTEVVPTRPNNQELSAFVIIQQRLAENDLTGHILETEADGWCHVCLPGRYEPERSFFTPIGWKDPRTVPGELLWPERLSEPVLKRLEARMGPFIFAGQIQQRPEPKGGGIIKRDWWKLWDRDVFPPMDFVLASLDTAYTLKTSNDFSALTIWGMFSGDTKAQATQIIGADGRPIYMDRIYDEGAPKVMLMHCWKERLELHQLVEKVAKSCTTMKVDLLLIENKAAGHSVAQEIRRLYANENFGVQLFDPKSQDKMARLYSVQHLFAEGIIYAPDRKWSDMVISEVAQFPHGKHDDITDTVSQALRQLRDMGLIARAPERLAELESLKIYPGHQNEPLYPV
jgi:predicted phage terminase large subunit-like protein